MMSYSRVTVLLLALLAAQCLALRKHQMGKVIDLDESNWRQVLKGEWMILL